MHLRLARPESGNVTSMNDPAKLKDIFERVESTVIETGDRKLRTEPMRDALRAVAANAAMTHTDADYFRKMVHVIFYSGMKAAIVTQKVPAIDRWFPSYSVAAGYGEKDILAILADPVMLRNKRKIRTCIDKAKKFTDEVNAHGSFAAYLSKTANVEETSVEALRPLWTDLKDKFLGRITSFHYLMDIGYNLVKPDRVITRIFSRLRLVDGLPNPDHPDPQKLTDDQLWQIVQVGQQIAESTQLPIRYVDLVFVVYGQIEGQELEGQEPDLPQGICLDNKPRCSLCPVRESCKYEPKTLSATA